jgi:DNA replication and repair protein RecF
MRERVAEMFNRRLETLYNEIFSGESPGKIRYRPSLNSNDVDAELRRRIRELAGKEIALHRTLWGPNYDKYVFYRGDTPLIHYASQGEHKIWMTLLKLAEGDIIRNDAGKEPLYLFDDLFAELDVNNSRRIVENIMRKQQALITTTDLNDLRRHGIDTSRGDIHVIGIR